MLKTMLGYKCYWEGLVFEEVNKSFSTQACFGCGSISGPKGLKNLGIREWTSCTCAQYNDCDVKCKAKYSPSGTKHVCRRVHLLGRSSQL